MNYDLWADTVPLNDLNVSNALYHWSGSCFLKHNRKQSWEASVLWNVVTMNIWYFLLQIFTFILMWDNPNDMMWKLPETVRSQIHAQLRRLPIDYLFSNCSLLFLKPVTISLPNKITFVLQMHCHGYKTLSTLSNLQMYIIVIYSVVKINKLEQ